MIEDEYVARFVERERSSWANWRRATLDIEWDAFCRAWTSIAREYGNTTPPVGVLEQEE